MSAPEDPATAGILWDWSEFRFPVSLFASVTATSCQQLFLTVGELAAMLETANANADTTEAAKRQLQLLKLGTFGRKKTKVVLDPVTGKRKGGSLRHDGNMLSISGIEGDYDGGVISFDAAHEALLKEGVFSILVTSPSHTEDKPRWRVLCPFSRVIVGQEGGESVDRLKPKRDMYMNWLNGVFPPVGCFGGESWTMSQIYYIGKTNMNPSHRVVIIEGTCIDLHADLELKRIGKPATAPQRPRLAALDGEPIPPPGETGEQAPMDEAQVRDLILSGESIHPSMMRLAGKWLAEGKGLAEAWAELERIMLEARPNVDPARWADRYAQIPEVIAWVFGKEQFKREDKKREGAKRKANREQAETRRETAEETEKAENDALPVIDVISGQRHLQADAGLKALRQARVPFYQRDRQMVRVAPIKAKDAEGNDLMVPGLIEVTKPILARQLGKWARWEKLTAKEGLKRIDPPREVVEQVADMVGAWPFDPLRGLIATATMRPDGSLLTKAGYDRRTGLLLFNPPEMPTIPDRPTRADALKAMDLLGDLLEEFPFSGEASRSVAMSMLWTPVLRGALNPAVPLHLQDGPTPGTGKTYLQNLSSMIALGEVAAVLSVPPNDPAEFEKRLHGAALEARPIIAIDNCNGLLEGDFLAQVTSSYLVSVRMFRTQMLARVENSFTVFANGNNITVGADMVRRCVRCAMDANLEDPGARVFKRNPQTLVRADRGKYVAAILTIARAYHIAGEPDPPHKLIGFERYSTLVAGAMTWLGWANPLDTGADLKADDPARIDLAGLLTEWPTYLTEYSSAELIEVANEERHDGVERVFTNPAWREAVLSVASDRQGKPDKIRLGKWLGRNKNRVVQRLKLVQSGKDPRIKWRVTSV